MNVGVPKAVDAINDDAWEPIPHWLDDGADFAETTYSVRTQRGSH